MAALTLVEQISGGMIDLDSYSSSKGYVGYFESAGLLSRREAARAAIDEVSSVICGAVAAGNCHIFGTPDQWVGISKDDLESIVYPLVSSNLIKIIENYLKLPRIVDISNSEINLLLKLSVAIMDIDGIYGHLFFRSGEIILYPHEDIGFGFFGLSYEGIQLGHEILDNILSNKTWR